MKLRTTYDPKPIPTSAYDWSAVDDETYDGAPDSGNRNQVGYGKTEAEAVADLMAFMDLELRSERYALFWATRDAGVAFWEMRERFGRGR